MSQQNSAIMVVLPRIISNRKHMLIKCLLSHLHFPYSTEVFVSDDNIGDDKGELGNNNREVANSIGGNHIKGDTDNDDNGGDLNRDDIRDGEDGLNGHSGSVPSQPDGGDHTSSVPSWISHAKNYFLGIEAGDDWKKLVESWLQFEKLVGYPDHEVSLLTSFSCICGSSFLQDTPN